MKTKKFKIGKGNRAKPTEVLHKARMPPMPMARPSNAMQYQDPDEPVEYTMLKPAPDFDPHIIPAMLDTYAKGGTDAEVCLVLGITTTQFRSWRQLIPKFNDQVNYGNTLAQAWWERAGRLNLSNPQFQTGLYMCFMQNRFGWVKQNNGNIKPADSPDHISASFTENHFHVENLDKKELQQLKVLLEKRKELQSPKKTRIDEQLGR